MFVLNILKALNHAKINYVLVGGYAVSLQGAIRGTYDLDLVIALEKNQFIAIEEALKNQGLISKLPVTAKQVFEFREEYISNKNLIAWSFYNPSNQSQQIDIIITHDSRKLKADTMKIHGIAVKVASKKSLIEMKKISQRPQDIEDIKALTELLKNEK